MLVGVGGTGKQSLTRFAAHISGCKIFQIALSRNYGPAEFRADLVKLYRTAGVDNEPVVFLFSDTQILQESFLEDINNMLNSGKYNMLQGVSICHWGWSVDKAIEVRVFPNLFAMSLHPLKFSPQRMKQGTSGTPVLPYRRHHIAAVYAGEVPGLFAPNELEQIVADVREWVEAAGPNPSREGCYSAFINRVRDNLHIVLTMSPVGDAYRSR